MNEKYSLKDELFANLKLEYPFKNLVEVPLSKLLSINTLDQLYQLTRQAEGQTFTEKILNTLNVSLQVMQQDLEKIPQKGPVIIVANHPFGGLEGILMASLLEKIRPDFKIMANYFLGLIPELRDLFIFVDPFAGKNAAAKNVTPLKQALRLLKNDGLLVIFPAGAVSHFKITQGVITDPPWQKNIGRLIEKASVQVLPVYFSGANKLPFQTLGLIHPFLRTLMLPGELINKQNMKFEMRIASLISAKKLNHLSFKFATVNLAFVDNRDKGT